MKLFFFYKEDQSTLRCHPILISPLHSYFIEFSFGVARFLIPLLKVTWLQTPSHHDFLPYTICTTRPVPPCRRPDNILSRPMQLFDHFTDLHTNRTCLSLDNPLVFPQNPVYPFKTIPFNLFPFSQLKQIVPSS